MAQTGINLTRVPADQLQKGNGQIAPKRPQLREDVGNDSARFADLIDAQTRNAMSKLDMN